MTDPTLIYRGDPVEAVEEYRPDGCLRLHLTAGNKRIGRTAWHVTEQDAHEAGVKIVDALEVFAQLEKNGGMVH